MRNLCGFLSKISIIMNQYIIYIGFILGAKVSNNYEIPLNFPKFFLWSRFF
jgi:hypothetical protein